MLVGGEIATSLVLLIGAGLVLKAFAQLLSSDPLDSPHRVLTLHVTTSPAQRTREFVIELALGSPPRALVRRVAAQGVVLVAGEIAAGLVGAMRVRRLLEVMLYGVSPLDVSTWIAATTLLLAAGFLAALVPAQRATRIDPVRALHAE